MLIRRRRFYKPKEILTEVERKVEELRLKGERIDYLTFVPGGEPTLDANLGREILLLKRIGIPIAIITNASLPKLLERGLITRTEKGRYSITIPGLKKVEEIVGGRV